MYVVVIFLNIILFFLYYKKECIFYWKFLNVYNMFFWIEYGFLKKFLKMFVVDSLLYVVFYRLGLKYKLIVCIFESGFFLICLVFWRNCWLSVW